MFCGHVSFEHGNMATRDCMAERPQSWNVPMKKSNSLKRARSLLSGIRRLQGKHNISLNGTKSKIFDRVCRSTTLTTCKACQCNANNACTVTVWKRPQCERGLFQRKWHKGNGIFMIFWSKTEWLRCQIQDILQVWKCKIWTQIWSVMSLSSSTHSLA